MAASRERLVAIGEIVRTHGLQGEVRVTPLTDEPDRFGRVTECVLWDASRDEREPRRISTARRHGEAVLLSFAGCDTVDAAQALVGRLVAVPEAEALPPGEGRFYSWQLVGCRVETEAGEAVGEVVDVERTAAHELWVVRDGAREHLIPAVAEIVVDLDIAGRRVVIRPPAGLLEL